MNIFLTGSSGFLGGELLVSLSKRADVSKIYCLIRAKNKEDANKRITSVFALHNDILDKQKIIPVIGDLTDPNLVKSLSENDELKRINLVIHSAANTSFSRIYDDLIEKVNIEGLRSILIWSQTLKQLETFTYIGTATICGSNNINTVIQEDESPHPNTKHLVKYTYSKMVGEMMLPEYLPKEKILVLRPSIIMGDSRPWMPRSPVILWALASINLLRLIPVNPLSQLDIIPIDYAVAAIEQLVFKKRKYSLYHISSGNASQTNALKLTNTIESYFPDRPAFKFIKSDMLAQMKKHARNPNLVLPGMELLNYSEYLEYWKAAIGENGQMRILFAGLEPYFRFVELGQVFDNSRLLEDTNLGDSPSAHEYSKVCIKYLEKIDILEGAIDP
jgi:thioester reductase-like protein